MSKYSYYNINELFGKEEKLKEKIKIIIDGRNANVYHNIFFNKKNMNIYKEIINTTIFLDVLDRKISISERIYCILNDIKKCVYCKNCNKPTVYLDYTRGYQTCCSDKCAAKLREINKIKRNENLDFIILEKEDVVQQLKTISENSGKIGSSLSNKRNFNLKKSVEHYTKFLDKYKKVSLSERSYCLMNGLKDRKKCKMCNNSTRFITIFEGYGNTFCSNKCQMKDHESVEKLNKSNKSISKIQKEFFNMLLPMLDDDIVRNSHFLKNEKIIYLTDDDREFLVDDKRKYIKPDFVFENRVIEFDGDYWHGHSANFDYMFDCEFDEGELPTSKSTVKGVNVETIWANDFLRNQILNRKGYVVHRVIESDFRNNPEQEINDCVDFITENIKINSSLARSYWHFNDGDSSFIDYDILDGDI